MTQSLGMDNHMPIKMVKKLPRNVVFRIKGSEFAVKGRVDWINMTLSEDTTIARTSEKSDTFLNRLGDKYFEGLPSDITFAVSSGEDHWEVTLKGLDYITFVAQDMTVQRDDKKFWGYIMADESDHKIPDYQLVFSRAWGYLAPIFRPIKGTPSQKINGRRPVVLEVAGAGGYIGSVTPGVRFIDGMWKILIQKDTNVGPDLQGVGTERAVRFSVQNPDRPEPIQYGVAFALNEVDLFPEFIASGLASEKGRVKNLMNIYTAEYVPLPEHRFASFDEYMPMGDQPGLTTLYQWMVWEFTEHLGQIEGLREEPADVLIDPEVSYGAPIQIGIIRHKATWMVIYDKVGKGRFSREGGAIDAIDGHNFDPTRVPVEPIKIHHLWALNPNNKREVGSSTNVGLHPVIVYEYDHNFDVGALNLNVLTLCDFARTGDAPTQAALGEWMWYVYGPVFATMDPKSAP